MEMMLEVVGVLVYDLITLLPGSAIWAPLGQDYYFNTSACSRLAFNEFLNPIFSALLHGMAMKYNNLYSFLQFSVTNISSMEVLHS